MRSPFISEVLEEEHSRDVGPSRPLSAPTRCTHPTAPTLGGQQTDKQIHSSPKVPGKSLQELVLETGAINGRIRGDIVPIRGGRGLSHHESQMSWAHLPTWQRCPTVPRECDGNLKWRCGGRS